ncbi:hypothetical protein ABXN37_10025 [Piscinibacter sakaiensis]
MGGIAQQAGTAVNGLAILACAALAWRAARAGRTAEHRRWALRLFLCVGGVWFFRIGLMAWLMVFQAPVGFDPTSFSGPFLTVLAFAQFLLPLLVLEGVLRAEAGARPGARRAMAAVVFALAALTALGVAARAHAMGGMACPLGAHYLPLPDPRDEALLGLLAELGLVQHAAGRLVYDERHLCHSLQERLYIGPDDEERAWHEGLLPPVDALPPAERARRRLERGPGRARRPALRPLAGRRGPAFAGAALVPGLLLPRRLWRRHRPGLGLGRPALLRQPPRLPCAGRRRRRRRGRPAHLARGQRLADAAHGCAARRSAAAGARPAGRAGRVGQRGLRQAPVAAAGPRGHRAQRLLGTGRRGRGRRACRAPGPARRQPRRLDGPRRVRRVDLMRYGHAMAIPVPGVRADPALRALREAPADGRVHLAHADLSGYSVFEEAFFHGERVGRRLGA